MSKRKPFNGDAGYKCSRRTPWGWCVVYDRERGGDWIDGGTRWVVAAYDRNKSNLGLLDCETERAARATLKAAAEGDGSWIGRMQPPPAWEDETDLQREAREKGWIR